MEYESYTLTYDLNLPKIEDKNLTVEYWNRVVDSATKIKNALNLVESKYPDIGLSITLAGHLTSNLSKEFHGFSSIILHGYEKAKVDSALSGLVRSLGEPTTLNAGAIRLTKSEEISDFLNNLWVNFWFMIVVS